MSDLLDRARQIVREQEQRTSQDAKKANYAKEAPLSSLNSLNSQSDSHRDSSGSAEGWRRRYHAEADELAIRDGLTLAVALRRAYSRLVAEWHLRNAQPDPAHCAGCGESLAGPAVHQFETGEVVHLTDDLECWIAYGERWRAAAVIGLREIGIPEPEGWEP